MSDEQQQHMKDLGRRFIEFMEPKYIKGAEEHGGDIHDMKALQLLNCAKEEVVDLWVYLDTLEEKLKLSEEQL